MLLATNYKALIIRIITHKIGVSFLLLLYSVLSSGQITNGEFLQDDLACLDDDPIAIIEVSILRNDIIDQSNPLKDFSIELDTGFPSKYGTSSISRISPNLNPTFGDLIYDTIMVRYEYHKSINKLDSTRYIVTNHTTQKKDSAYIIFDIGCHSNSSPDRITCDPDKIIPTIANKCYAQYTIPPPNYSNNTPPISTTSFSTYQSTLGEYNIGSTVKLDTGTYDRFIALGGFWTDRGANRDACETYLEVKDLQAPNITCPGNITSCQPTVTWEDPIYSDNCEILNLEQTSGLNKNSIFPIGTTTIEYTVTDHTGLSTRCNFDIKVVDLSEVTWQNNVNSSLTCSDGNIIDLNLLLTPPTDGTWSANTSNGIFTPSDFPINTTQDILFTYIKEGCSQTITYELSILPSLESNIQPISSSICKYSPTFVLHNYFNTSTSGSWEIDNKPIIEFTPSNYSIGDHVLSYSNNDSICPSGFMQTINIIDIQSDEEVLLYHCGKKGEITFSDMKIDTVLNLDPELLLSKNTNTITYEAEDFDSYNFKAIYFSGFYCSTVDSYTINILNKSEEAFAGEDITLNYTDDLFTLNATPPTSGTGKWKFDASVISLNQPSLANTSGSINRAGSKKLIWGITSGENCPTSYDTLEVTRNDLIIPTAFTPNNDGINDFLVIDEDNKMTSSIKIEVINRWGQVIYKNQDYNNDWDGTLDDGRKIPIDTYYLNIAYNNTVKRETLYIKY